MDLAILEADPNTFPPDIDPALWLRYLKGARAFDNLYGSGKRCPNNHSGTRCTCDIPREDYCKYFRGVESLAEQIGGAVASMFMRMN